MPPLASIIIVTYNNQDDIVDCIESILTQDYKNFEVIIVDNLSQDKTVDIIEGKFGNDSHVRLVRNTKNDGYAGGNNLGFHHARGEFIVILNPDLIVEKRWLQELFNAYGKHQDAGIICSSVLLFGERDIINACGNDVHLAGFVFSRFYMASSCECKEGAVAAPSGASMMYSRKRLEAIGRQEPFDTSRFVMEYSDTDLAVDFIAHDYRCYVAPLSKVYHKYRFKMNPQRFSTLEKGRYQLLGHFTRKTLFKMLPALIVAELIVWTFALRTGGPMLRAKMAIGAWWFLNWRRTFRKNNSLSKDLRLLREMSTEIMIYQEIEAWRDGLLVGAQGVANNFFRFIRKSVVKSAD